MCPRRRPVLFVLAQVFPAPDQLRTMALDVRVEFEVDHGTRDVQTAEDTSNAARLRRSSTNPTKRGFGRYLAKKLRCSTTGLSGSFGGNSPIRVSASKYPIPAR